MSTVQQPLQFFATPRHECSYLPEREAVTVFADPAAVMTTAVYSQLINYGFRRSGEYVYRPDCPACNACIPVRISVADFQPRRSQRRNWRRNQDLTVNVVTAGFNEAHFDLYRRYIAHRHAGGGMDDPDPEKFMSFLCSSWCDTFFHEFRLDGLLIGTAVVDHLRHGLSAVYTYFEPDFDHRGLGVFGLLHQIEEARRLGLAWVYLGYWIPECDKMAYKDQYRPLEIFRDSRWQRLEGGSGLDRP